MIDEILSVLRASEELVGSSLASVGLWASQVVYQLTAAARALMTLQQLFLHHILSLRITSHP